MKTSFSNAKQYIAQLKSIEQQINQNQLQDAATQLNRLAKTSSHDPRIFLLGSRLAEAAGNPEGMLQAARKACQLAPDWPTASIYLAGVLAGRGDAEEAIVMAAQALHQASNDIELLIQAAAVAQRLSLHVQTLQWLRQAEQIKPGDVGIRYKIGLTLIASGDPAGAVDVFTELLQQQPTNAALLSARVQACLGAKQTEQAILDSEVLVALEPDNEVHPFYLALARGETPATQPAALVVGLFDGFAARYDKHWVGQLKYTLPKDVAQMIIQWHPDRKVDVLDLGCGTGLLGLFLGPIEGVLVGADLSLPMMEQASRHGVYASFHQVNVLDALQATPANHYDVITALDVLNYVGSLEPVMANALRILTPGGRFVFSCEAGAEIKTRSKAKAKVQPGYALPATLRYTHLRSYVQRLLDEAGFEDVVLEDRVLRTEAEEPVQGFLVTARKPTLAT